MDLRFNPAIPAGQSQPIPGGLHWHRSVSLRANVGVRGVSDFNVPHNFVFNFQYDLPVPAVVKTHVLANTLFGGWQVGGIYTRQSGAPFTLRIGSDRALTGKHQTGGSDGGARAP